MHEPETPAQRIAPLPWMTAAPTQAVLAALGRADARFVGGAVRDALLGRPVLDIDIATRLHPDEVMRRLERAAIAVVPTGLAHGTVTALAPPSKFEITTLRRDVETFGRRARVVFTQDWAEDAARRDFTMNALYLDHQGNVFDFVDGLIDLRAGRVRFVGDPRRRIREDVLRLVRFYRFHAHYGTGEADAHARAAARELTPLVANLSAERVAGEVRKLLAAPDPVPTLVLMREDGVLAMVLPQALGLERLAALAALEATLALEPDPVRRLGALVATDLPSAAAAALRLKLRKSERDRLAALASPPWQVDLAADRRAQRRALHRLGAALYGDLVLLRAAERGDTEKARALVAFAAAARPQRFPLKGSDLTQRGLAPGPAVGRLLAELEAWWEAGDFGADRRTCLAELERRLS
jgi:poly(A) polymerase